MHRTVEGGNVQHCFAITDIGGVSPCYCAPSLLCVAPQWWVAHVATAAAKPLRRRRRPQHLVWGGAVPCTRMNRARAAHNGCTSDTEPYSLPPPVPQLTDQLTTQAGSALQRTHTQVFCRCADRAVEEAPLPSMSPAKGAGPFWTGPVYGLPLPVGIFRRHRTHSVSRLTLPQARQPARLFTAALSTTTSNFCYLGSAVRGERSCPFR